MASRNAYAALLKDPRWQRKRLEIMQRDGFACRLCRATDKTLNVHHNFYLRDLAPWEYGDEQLATVCEDCHGLVTKKIDRLKVLLSTLDAANIDFVIGVVSALAAEDPDHDDGDWAVMSPMEIAGFGCAIDHAPNVGPWTK